MAYRDEIKEVLSNLEDDADIKYFKTLFDSQFVVAIVDNVTLKDKTFNSVDLGKLNTIVELITYYVFFESSTFTERELKIERAVNGVKYFYFVITLMYELFTKAINQKSFNDKDFKLKFDSNYHNGHIKIKITSCYPGEIKYYMNLDANGVGFELILEDHAACLTHALYDDTIKFKLLNPVNYDNAEFTIQPEKLTKSFIVKAIKDTILD